MPSKIKIASTSDIPDASMKSFNVSGKRIVVCNIGGDFFAMDDTCTHEQCSFSTEGFLDGEKIICGCHGSVFEAKTGAVKTPPATSNLKTYRVTKEGNDIYINL
ncbi:non-heme iron oxygenase ferredoxin subunit [Candidatus Gottesmanbacteria bacterium]|nr:non-heme iron oxygenase ferredoxin subunit [Candidatus Gottesmanbacteria bacterium]